MAESEDCMDKRDTECGQDKANSPFRSQNEGKRTLFSRKIIHRLKPWMLSRIAVNIKIYV